MSIRHRALVDYQSDNDGSVSEEPDGIDSHELWERKRTSKTRAFVNKYRQFAERRKEEYRRSHARFTVPSKWEQPQQRDRHAGLYSPDCTVSYSGLRRTPSPISIETSRGPELGGVDGLTKLYMRDKLSDIKRDKPNYSSRHNNRSRSPIFPSLEDREVFDIVSRRDADLYGESDRFQTDEMFVPVDWVRTREPDCHDDRGRNLSPHDRHRTSPGRHRQDRRRSVSPPHFQDQRRSVSPSRYPGRNVSVSPVTHYHNRRRSISPEPHYERRRSPSPLYPERRRPITPDSRYHHQRSISPHSQHFHRENDQNWSEGGYHGRISPSKRFEKQSFDAEKDMFHSEIRKRSSDSPKHLGDPIPPPPPPPVLSVSSPPSLPYMPTDYSKPLPFKSSAVFQTESVKQSLDLLEKVKRKQEILSRCELKIGELYRKRSKLSNAPSAFFPSIQKIHILESCHSPVTFVNKLSLTFNSTSKIAKATELSHPAKEGAVTEQSETQKKLVDLVIPQGLSETLKLLSDNKQATSNASTLDETQGLHSSLFFSPEPQNFKRILDSPRRLENWDLPSHSNDKLQPTYNPILEMAYGRTETTHTNIGFSSHRDIQIPWEETRHLNVGRGWPNYSRRNSPSRKLSNKVNAPPPSVPFRVLPPEQHSVAQREQARPGRSQITLNLIPKGNSPNISTVTKEDSAYVEKVEEFLAKIQGGHDINKRVDRESVVLSSDDDDVIYVGETKRQSSSRRRNRVSPLRCRSSEKYRCMNSNLMKHIETNAQSVNPSPELRQSPPLHGPPNKKLCLINQIERSNTNLRDNDHVNESPVLVAGNEACSGEPLLYQPLSKPVPAFNALPGRTLTLVVGKDNSFNKQKQEHSSHTSSVNRSYKLPSNPQKILEQQSPNLKQIVVKDLKNCRSVKNRIPFEKINNQVQQLQPMVSLPDHQQESISKGCDLIRQSKLPTLDSPVVEPPCNTKYVASADDFPKFPAKLQNNSNCTNTSDKKPFVLNETVDNSLKQTNCIVDIGAKRDMLNDKDKINMVSINNEISEIKTYIEEPKQLMSDKHNVNISQVLNSQSQPSECVTVKDQMETSNPNERQDPKMKTADDSDQSSVKTKKPVISEIVTQSNTDMKVLSSDRTSNKTNPINSTSSSNPDEVSKMPDSGKKDTSNFEAATKLIPEASLKSDDIDNIFNHGNKVADDVRKIQMGDVRLKKVFNNTLRNRTINKNLCIINELLCLNNEKYGPRIVVSTIEEHIIYYVHYLYNHCINGLPSILRKFFTPIKELSGKIKTVLKCCEHCFMSDNQSSFIIKNTISSEGILSDNSCNFFTNSLTSFSSNRTNNEERHSSLSDDKNLMVEKNTSPHFEKSCDEDSKVITKKNCNNIDLSSSPLLCMARASKISSQVDIIGNNVADDRTGKEIQEKTLPPLETPGNATDKNKVIDNPLESTDLESVGNNPNKTSWVEMSESSQMHGVNKENKRFDESLKIVKKNDSLKSQQIQLLDYRTKYDKNIDLIASDNQKLIDPCNIAMKNNTCGFTSDHASVPPSPPKRARITYGDDNKDAATIQDVTVLTKNYSLDLGLRQDNNCSKEDNSALNSQGNKDRSQITTQGLFDDASKTNIKPEMSSSIQKKETIKSSTSETHTSSFRIEDKTTAGGNSVVKTKSQILASNVPSFTKKTEKIRRKDPIARVREIQSSSDHIKNIISKIDQVDNKLLYFIKNKLVLKKCNVDGKALVKILIPEDKIDEIINVAHTEFCSHGNVKCVLSILEKHFSPFPNLVESVKRNVLLCNFCNGNSNNLMLR